MVTMKLPESSIDLLKLWRHRVRNNQTAHYEMEERCDRWAFWFGVISAILSGAIGVLILVTAKYDPPTWLRILIGGISILASVITTVATSGRWGEKAAQHHATAAAYGAVLRRIEEAIVLPPKEEDATRNLLAELREQMDEIPTKAPPVPKKVWLTLPAELTPTPEKQNLSA